jgi:alkylhydroperoxidase family enzyme
MQGGLTEEKIAALETHQESDVFTPQEKIALRFAERMALSHHEIDDDLFRALRVLFTDAQIVELGMMIGQYIGFGRLVSVLDLERSACPL